MDKELYTKLRREIQDKCPECKKHLAALDQVYGYIGSNGSSGEKMPEHNVPHIIFPRYNPIHVAGAQLTRQKVEMALEHVGREFNSHEVMKHVNERFAGTSPIAIGVALKGMVIDGSLVQLSKGMGRTPSKYRKNDLSDR